MDFLTPIFFILLFSATLWYCKPLNFESLPKWIPLLGFGLKIGVGLIFLQLYVYDYPKNIIPSDAIRFFNDSKILNHVFYESPKEYLKLLIGIGNEKEQIRQYLSETQLWDSGRLSILNDFRNVIRFNSLIHFISNGSALIHILFMSFISFIGIQQIFKAIVPLSALKPFIIFIALLFIPSMLFWTSGILKEPFVLLGIGLITRLILFKEPWKNKIIPLIISLIILICFKPYVLFCLIPAIIFYLVNKHLYNYKIYKTVISFSILFVFLIILFPHTKNKIVHFASKKQTNFTIAGRGGLLVKGDTCFYYISKIHEKNIIYNKQNQTINIIKNCPVICYSYDFKHLPISTTLLKNDKTLSIKSNEPQANSFFDVTPINNSSKQLFKNTPEALMNALFRPFLFDNGSKLKYPAIIEIIGITFFVISSCLFRRKLNNESINIIFSLIVFSSSLLLIIGWLTPISGAIFRYRFPAQLAFVIIGILIIDPTKIRIFKFNKSN